VTAESVREVATALAGLPSSWTALADVPWPGRDAGADRHVVVGPGGVFVVEAADWSGWISVDEGVLREDDRSRDAAVEACAASAAVLEELGVPVSPMLCLARDEHVAVATRGVLVCTTRNLVPILRTCPVVLSARQVSQVLALLESAPHDEPAAPTAGPSAGPAEGTSPAGAGAAADEEPAADGSAATDPAEPACAGGRAPDTRNRRAERTRRWGRFLVAAAMLAGLVVAGPDLAGKWPAVSSQITQLIADDGACPSPRTAADSAPSQTTSASSRPKRARASRPKPARASRSKPARASRPQAGRRKTAQQSHRSRQSSRAGAAATAPRAATTLTPC
jgi:hypothetical protein